MPVGFIMHKGKELLFINLNGMTDQSELINDGKEAARIILEQKKYTRFLCDFTNSSVGTEFLSKMKDDGKYILKNIPVKTGVTGITGLKKIMLKGYIRFTGSKLRTFSTLEEAKEYLVEGE